MDHGFKLTILINKLKERGVISNKRAKTLCRLAKLLDSPVGRLVGYWAVKAIASIILNSINDR
jgi:hypothetical protein